MRKRRISLGGSGGGEREQKKQKLNLLTGFQFVNCKTKMYSRQHPLYVYLILDDVTWNMSPYGKVEIKDIGQSLYFQIIFWNSFNVWCLSLVGYLS